LIQRALKRLNREKINYLVKQEGDLLRLAFIMVLCFGSMVALSPGNFFTWSTFRAIGFQVPEFGILALGMMLAIISGGIDLSVIGVGNLAAILSANIMVALITPQTSEPTEVLIMILAVLAAVATGAICGAINGLLISKVGIAPILTTLGTMQLFTGVSIAITEGHTVVGLPQMFEMIGHASIWVIPVPLLIFFACAIIVSILLGKTSFGKKLYMMGSNPTASMFAGLRNDMIILKTYTLSGTLAAISCIIISSRTNSANPSYAVSYVLLAILLCVLGGVRPTGGHGRVMGVVMAVFTLQFLSTGFNMMGFSSFLRQLIWGAVLVLVLLLNYYGNREKKARSLGKSDE